MHAAGVDNSSTQLRNPHKIHHKVRHLQYMNLDRPLIGYSKVFEAEVY